MLDLGATDFYLAVPSVPAPELEALSTRVFDAWDQYIDQTLSIPDYSLFLQVEEGSVSGRGLVGAGLAAIYIGLGNYGDFIQGIRTVSEQLGAAREYLVETARLAFDCPPTAARASARSGTMSGLNRLFARVQSGELSVEQAMARAEALLGDEAREAPEFLGALRAALKDCPRVPTQLGLLLEHEGLVPNDVDLDSKRRERAPRPSAPIAPASHLRIEVWRESKREHKQTRITRV